MISTLPEIRDAESRGPLLALTALLPLTIGLPACDTGPTEVEPERGERTTVAQLQCTVEAAAGTFECSPDPGLGRNVGAVMVGGQDRLVRLSSSNVSTSNGVLSADVTVQNLTLQPLATSDGTNGTRAGVRVFFNTGPTNGVEVNNADGTGNFTASDQPFHQYNEEDGLLGGDGILSATSAETSSSKTWEFTLNGAGTFQFGVYVNAVVPDANALAVSLVEVAGGDTHTCGLTSGDQAYCWGRDGSGQLGDGSGKEFDGRTTPQAVDQGEVSFVEITGGGTHTCARTANNQAYCWGGNGSGQVGDGTTSDRTTPVAVDQGSVDLTSLAAGGNHSCGLNSGLPEPGQAYCWGNNASGQIGDGSGSDQTTPVAVDQGKVSFTSLVAGLNHTCGLTSGGQAYCWGDNGSGQIGDGSGNDQAAPVAVDQSVDNGVTFASLAVGDNHSCGLTSGGQAYCWGENGIGQLGDGSTNDQATPVAVDQTVDNGVAFEALALGSSHTCGRTSGGQVYCWGENFAGQLGDGTTSDETTPVAVDQSAVSFVEVTAGRDHTCGLTSGGQAYCWGENGGFGGGQLGDGTTTDRSTPVPVASTK